MAKELTFQSGKSCPIRAHCFQASGESGITTNAGVHQGNVSVILLIDLASLP